MPIPESARKTKSRKFRFAPKVADMLDELSPEPRSQNVFVSWLITEAYAKSTRATKKGLVKA